MNLTPSTVRNDLKCGKGAISEGEKCTKGQAQRVQAKRSGRVNRGLRARSNKSGPMHSAVSGFQANVRSANRTALGAMFASSGGPVGARAARNVWADGFEPLGGRNDLKCGKGAISEGEKCTKGAAQRVQPKRGGRMRGGRKVRGLGTAAKIAGAAAVIGGAAYLQQTARRNMLQRGATAAPGSPSNIAFLNEVRKLGGNNETARKMRERAFANKIAESFAKKRRDSVYAVGFTPNFDQLAI
jgi:hypothetical protein